MEVPKPTNHQVNTDGLQAVVTKLREFGLDAEIVGGRKRFIQVRDSKNSHSFRVKVKAIRDDWNWQIDLGQADRPADNENIFWVFVNLKQYASPPKFWILTDEWLRNDILEKHRQYLNRNDGHRKRNDNSTHHSIDEARIANWENRWDVLGIL